MKILFERIANTIGKKEIEKQLSDFLGVEIKDLEFWCKESTSEVERFSLFDEDEGTEVITVKNVTIKKHFFTYFIGNYRHDLSKNLYPDFYKILIKLKK
jgi:hypothetical protein